MNMMMINTVIHTKNKTQNRYHNDHNPSQIRLVYIDVGKFRNPVR